MTGKATWRALPLGMLCAALTACTLRPDFVRPTAQLPAQWQGAVVSADALASDAQWWAEFEDPTLAGLAAQALQANLDIQLGANRVQQSRAARGIVAADSVPSVSATASGMRARNSEVGLNDPSGNGGREDYGLFQAGIGVSWELDLWSRARRSGQSMALLMVDIDHFKQFNDRFGHPHGDACLRAVATALAGCASRSTDVVARYGGEEFAVVVPGTSREGVLALAETMRRAVAQLRLVAADPHQQIGVTISVGVARVGQIASMDAGPLLAATDAALYEAKRHGRNRVVEGRVGPAPLA